MPESVSRDPLVWIDCEMTGLDYEHDTIMSIACFVTDHDLGLLEPGGFEVFVHHSQEQLDAMGEWCQTHHGKSGLTDACLQSKTSPAQAADDLFQYIKSLVPERRRALLAGNSVHADRMFLLKPPYKQIVQHLHHRLLDVSAIKEAARRWAPPEILKKSPQKAGKHDAKIDILESIEEARFYRKTFFKADPE
ncbi:MAG: hypothetical protein M1822_002644 [Bathelium mastoideum]|nr:MAG: hypothetical protein M1822_002644 [Bathelium mastoideum]